MILILRPMNPGETIGTIDGRRGHGLDSAKSGLQWRYQSRMPDMEAGEKHHPIEAGQGGGTLCQSTALRAWHRGLHWCAHHWAPLGPVGHGLGTIWARATMAWGHSVRFDPRQGGAPVGGRPQ